MAFEHVEAAVAATVVKCGHRKIQKLRGNVKSSTSLVTENTFDNA